MTDVRSLVWHMRECHARGNAPETRAADAKLWFLALGELVRQGSLETAAGVAGPLRAAFPKSGMIARLALLIETMPPPASDRRFAAFADRSDAAVQIANRDGARTVVLAFCGRHGNLGMPLPIAHRWFGMLDASIVYLRDAGGGLYLEGIPTLASSRQETVAALGDLSRINGAERCLCYGNSTGAYAALLYGLELGAAAVLALNTIAVFPEDRMVLHRSVVGMRRHDHPPDLASLYAAASFHPRAHLVFSADNSADLSSAATMSGFDGVTVEAVPDHDGHDAQVALVARGRFLSMLLDFENEWRRPAATLGAS